VFYVKDAFIESIDEYIGTTYSDQNGNWSFTFTKKPQYNFVRSTFTKYGFTSGFSDAFPVEESAMTCYVTNVNDSGPGSFREALECANTTPGPSKIKFAIPGPGPYIIKPVTTFPLIGNNTDPLEILGETQKSSGVGYGIQNITLSGELLTPTLSSWKFINTSISSILFDSILNNDIEAYASKFVSVEFKNIRGINVGSPYTNSRALNK
jgi:hypothetical protein